MTLNLVVSLVWCFWYLCCTWIWYPTLNSQATAPASHPTIQPARHRHALIVRRPELNHEQGPPVLNVQSKHGNHGFNASVESAPERRMEALFDGFCVQSTEMHQYVQIHTSPLLLDEWLLFIDLPVDLNISKPKLYTDIKSFGFFDTFIIDTFYYYLFSVTDGYLKKLQIIPLL